VDPRAIARLEGTGKLKIFNDLIGTRTRYLPACSIVPQPTTLPRDPIIIIIIIMPRQCSKIYDNHLPSLPVAVAEWSKGTVGSNPTQGMDV
jgi:hypothetical protein